MAAPTATHVATPREQKKHTTRNVILAIIGIFILLVGGCTVALIAAGGNAINDAIDEAADPSNTQDDKTKGTTPAEEEPEQEITTSQENALESAESYLAFSGFSEAGLIDQLSSPAGDDFPKADAEWAVAHVDADWNEEAVEAAESYLEFSSFSRSGLIEQLTSPAGDQFTKAQATYAANEVGL